MKVVPLTIRRCPAEVHQALKKNAQDNHRSLNAEVLTVLEREAQTQEPLTGVEWARRLRKARKLLSEPEHRELAQDIERGANLVRHERLY